MLWFGKKKMKSAESVIVVPAPAARHYVLTESEQLAFDVLPVDGDGFVRIGDVTHGLMNQQSQYISRYMDGCLEGTPMLAGGLRVDVASSSYHAYRIHRDDVLEFVARVRAYRNR